MGAEHPDARNVEKEAPLSSRPLTVISEAVLSTMWGSGRSESRLGVQTEAWTQGC